MENTQSLLSAKEIKQYFPIPKASLFQKEKLYLKANDGVSLEIGQGETFSLVGESGSGKSTFGRTILQLNRPTSGETLYFGRNLWEFRPLYLKNALKKAEKWKKEYDKGEIELFALRIFGGLLAMHTADFALGVKELETRFKGVSVEKELEKLKEKYKGREDFEKCEKKYSEGIDLNRLSQKELARLRTDLQIIFQDPYSSLNPRMTVREIIEEGVITHNCFKKGSKEMREYISELIKECGLQEYMLSRYPHQFSGGQRQRICIARALAVKPKFVVCDECVSALDLSVQSQILNLLTRLKKKEGLTYLFISHDLSVVKYLSDRIGVMYLGKIVEVGKTEEIFSDPRHPYTIALLSAIPSLYEKKKEKIILEGSPPSNITPPKGCPFHTRCFMAREECECVPVPMIEVETGHFAACHYAHIKTSEKKKLAFENRERE